MSLSPRIGTILLFVNNMHYVYVLKSQKDGKFYTGYTNDLKRRFEDHQLGKATSTKHRLPFDLVYYEAGLSKFKALKREKHFKTGFGRKFLKNRI